MRSIRSRIHAVVEQGSVAVEYAIFFPLVVVLVLFLIQLSWVGFQSATFDYATRTMVLNLDPDRATEAPDLDAFVADGIVQTQAPLDAAQLTVSHANLNVDVKHDEKETGGRDDKTLYKIERVSREATYAHLSGTVTYHIGLLLPLPGFSEITLVKALDSVLLVNSVLEVS